MKRHRSRKGAPGIVDVAHAAGVSPATVSRYFNNPAVVRAPTRERIETVATDLGYIRDRMAGALHNRSSGTIGLVVPTINNAIFAELIEAFSTQLQQHDRTMLIASHNYNLELEVEIIRSLLERRTDAVAIVGFEHANQVLEMLHIRDIPVISLWNFDVNHPLCNIGVDNRLAAVTVTQHLIELGHRDIAFLFPDTENNDRARDRKDGALSVMQKYGRKVPLDRVLNCPYSIAAAKAIGIDLIKHNRPTAVVCGNDIIAHGLIYAAQSCGLNLPTDLSIVGIGDFAGSAEIFPALTTVRLPADQIGRRGAEVLVQMCQSGRNQAPANQSLPAELVIRGSTMRIDSSPG